MLDTSRPIAEMQQLKSEDVSSLIRFWASLNSDYPPQIQRYWRAHFAAATVVVPVPYKGI